MAIPFIQAAFSSGELAPELWARVDIAKFHTAASTLRNCFVNYKGGASSRAGTAFVGRCKQSGIGAAKPRLIPFQFSVTQSYALEFGDNYMRIATMGAYVTETPLAITDITQADPAQVSVGNTYSNGDWVFISGVAGMSQVNGETYIIGGATTGTINLFDLDGNPVDSTGFGAYVSGGEVQRIFTLPTPYAAADLPLLKWTQSADVMTLVHPNYPPMDLARFGPTTWTLTQTTFGAAIAPPSSVSATASSSGTTGYSYVVTAVDSQTGQESVASEHAPVINAVDFTSTAGSVTITWSQVVGAVRYNVYRAPIAFGGAVPGGATYGLVGSSFGNQWIDSNATVDFTTGPPADKNPFAAAQVLFLQALGGGSGYTTATATLTSGTGSGFIASGVIIGGAVVSWIVVEAGQNYRPGDALVITGDGTGASAAFTLSPPTGTYPGVAAYFQQRRIYANSLNSPDTFWASKPGAFTNFDVSFPVSDTDAITATPWAEQVNGIQFMIPMPSGLVTLTGLEAWQIAGSGTFGASSIQPITPANTQAQQQAFQGCSNTVTPIKINYDILYVNSLGAVPRDLSYNFFVNIYTGADISLLSAHLFAPNTILEWSWSQEPYKIIWAVRNDGILLSLTYLKEQELLAWAHHDTIGGFGFISTCSVSEPPVNATYFIVARFGNFYLERMDNRIWETVEDTWCVDSGLRLAMPEPSAAISWSAGAGAVTFTASSAIFTSAIVNWVLRVAGGIAVVSYVSPTSLSGTWSKPIAETVIGGQGEPGTWTLTEPTTVVSNLTHLIGQTVTGTADGIVIPPTVVSPQGTITLPFPATAITVGLPFTAQIQTVYLDDGQPTIQGRRKNIFAVTARVAQSLSISAGTDQPDGSAQSPPIVAPTWSNLASVPNLGATYQTPGGRTATSLFTGDLRVVVPAQWQKPGQVAIQQSNPLPLNLTAVIPEYLPGDMPEVAIEMKPTQGGQPGMFG